MDLRERLGIERRVVQAGAQRVGRPLFSPLALVRGMNAQSVDVTPLYAGRVVTAIRDIRPAADVTRELSV